MIKSLVFLLISMFLGAGKRQPAVAGLTVDAISSVVREMMDSVGQSIKRSFMIGAGYLIALVGLYRASYEFGQIIESEPAFIFTANLVVSLLWFLAGLTLAAVGTILQRRQPELDRKEAERTPRGAEIEHALARLITDFVDSRQERRRQKAEEKEHRSTYAPMPSPTVSNEWHPANAAATATMSEGNVDRRASGY